MYFQHSVLQKLEGRLASLLHRVDVLRATGVSFGQPERDALARVIREMRSETERFDSLKAAGSTVAKDGTARRRRGGSLPAVRKGQT